VIEPFSLFQPAPVPPAGVASWIDLQMLEAARAQSSWAANQAYWSRFGAWTQLAAFIAAGFAAWFTWNAAVQARVQAGAAQDELRIAREGREAESRVRAFELLSLIDEWFLPDRTFAESAFLLREQTYRVMRTVEAANGFREEPRRAVRENGVRIAAGIHPDSILVRWIKLFDDADALRVRNETLHSEFTALLAVQGRPELKDPSTEEDVALAESIYAQDPSLAAARDTVSRFWADFDAFRASLESIGRGGSILAGNVAVVTTSAGDLTIGLAADDRC